MEHLNFNPNPTYQNNGTGNGGNIQPVGSAVTPTFTNTQHIINQHNQYINNPNTNTAELNMNLGQQLMGSLQKDTKLLDLTQIHVNQEFSGVVWCSSVKNIPNKYDRTKFDSILTLIDKNGILFTSRIYSHISINESVNYTNTPIHIIGVAIKGTYDTIYRVDEITSFVNSNLSIDCFVQSIPNFEEHFTLFERHLSAFENSPTSYQLAYNSINNIWNIKERFKVTSYKPFFKGLLGTKILVYNAIINSFIAKSPLNLNISENMGKLKFLTLMYMVKLYMEVEGQDIADINNKMLIMNILTESGFTPDDIYEVLLVLTDSNNKTELMKMIESEIKTVDIILK